MRGKARKSEKAGRRMLRAARLLPAQAAEAGAGELSHHLGREIRSLRHARDMTLEDLGAKTGLSVGFLSQIERGLSNPSIIALHDISRALGVNISWFFDEGDPGPPEERDFIVRARRRRTLHYSHGIVDSLLTPYLDGQLELLLSRFAPGATSGEAPYTHIGEEAGVVIAGQLDLWINGKRFRLEEGDSFTFKSTLPHRYRNPGATETVVIWAITPPSY
jgi:transcriptional regulator with XRE-family HTH domain